MANEPSAQRRRFRGLAAMVSVAIASIIIGAVGATLVKSPAQRALDEAAPPLTPVTDTVQTSQVSETVSFGGAIQHVIATPITFSGGDGERSVVSAIKVAKGATVASGAAVAEVSGRPIIVLPGTIPAYRTLLPGYQGTDVTQLQTALRGLGLLKTTESTYGPATQAAVAALYDKLGYSTTQTGTDDYSAALASEQAAAEGVDQANESVAQATTTLARAQRPLASSETPDPSAAQSRSDSIDDATQALASAQKSAARARESLDAAKDALAAAKAKSGTTVPLNEIVYVPSLPAIVSAISASPGQTADGVGMTLSSGALGALTSDSDPAQFTDITTGMAADIIDDNGTSHPGKVTQLTVNQDTAAGPTNPASGSLMVTPDKPLDPASMGQQVRVLVHTTQTDTPVLNVALAAIATNNSGQSIVRVQQSDGSVHEIPVTTGAQGDGRVQVTGDLTDGDTVLIGATPAVSPTP